METPKTFFIFQETETLESFLYFRLCNFLSPSLKKIKIKESNPTPTSPQPPKIVIFQEIKLSESKNKNFLYFWKCKPALFSPSSKNKKNLPGENFLCFRK